MRVTFRAYPATVEKTFTCACCGKPKRKRRFTVECTLNPFNTEATTPAEVSAQSRRQAKAQAARFMAEPWCATCEGDLSYADKRALSDRRARPTTGDTDDRT